MLLLGGVLLGAGCASSPRAAQALELRQQRLARTFRAIGESEATRPPQLERTVRAAGDALALSVEQTAQNGRELDAAIHYEFQRFADNQPRYQRDLARIFGGKPENIELFLITLFY